MHGGSSKKDKKLTIIPIWMSLEPSIPPGGDNLVYLECTNWKWLAYGTTCKSFLKKNTWYTKVEQMYEHIAYELRYEHLSSIEHGSICKKAQII